MQGDYVSLWVYSRGESARDLPYTLWQMVEANNDWERLLWNDPYEPTRVSRFGDLVHWITFMHGDGDPKVFLLISDNQNGDIAGFIWFNRIIDNTAYGSIWIDPKFRGKPHPRESAKLALRWAHEIMNWHTIYTVTPWPDVRNFDRRIGFKEVGFIPKVLGKDVWLLEHKENCHG